MDCKQELPSNVSPSSLSTLYGGGNNGYYNGGGGYSSGGGGGYAPDQSGLLINCIKEEREDFVDSSCFQRASCNNGMGVNPPTLNSNALGPMNTRLQQGAQQAEECSSSSSPGKMSAGDMQTNGGTLYGQYALSPTSAGSYDPNSPNASKIKPHKKVKLTSSRKSQKMGDEGSPEVSSSSAEADPPKPAAASASSTGAGASSGGGRHGARAVVVPPVDSLTSTDIGEVDLEFWDLDINESPSSNKINENSSGSGSGRDDMSPPGSVNGNTMDSYRESRRNRGPTSRQQEELCLVCGDRASGYHYNALTCEGCKGFFRRSITKNAVYQCKYGNNCEIDMYMRRKCQECRLKKCLKVGMRPECVVPEYQCAVKREAKRAQKDKDKPNSTTKDRPPSPDLIRSTSTTTTTTTTASPIAISPDNRKSMDDRTSDMELTMEEEELIERLVFFQEEFESPSSEDMAKIANSHPSDDDGENRYKHITEITIYTIRLIVEFAKRVPWFDTLIREDQITLLKACSSEVMMLRTARRYDLATDTIVFANDQPYTRENYNSAGLGDCTNAIFHFCRQMCMFKVDNAEYALLTAVVLFSDRPHLIELKKVEQVQEIYLEALRKYELKNRPKGPLRFARLLSVLTELRSLGSLNSEMCFSLKLKNKELPPFLAEIWDINS